MKIEQYIQKEAEKYSDFGRNTDSFIHGLSAGIEDGKKFARWYSDNLRRATHATIDQLFELFLNERNIGSEALKRNCPNCKTETQQTVKLYNPECPEDGEVWQCSVCKENTDFVTT